MLTRTRRPCGPTTGCQPHRLGSPPARTPPNTSLPNQGTHSDLPLLYGPSTGSKPPIRPLTNTNSDPGRPGAHSDPLPHAGQISGCQLHQLGNPPTGIPTYGAQMDGLQLTQALTRTCRFSTNQARVPARRLGFRPSHSSLPNCDGLGRLDPRCPVKQPPVLAALYGPRRVQPPL